MSMRWLPALAGVMLVLLLPAGVARAAQSYDACTGFIDSVPATISTQGVWCLRSHLSTAMTSGAAITLAANNVTIDCNGFRLGGLAAGNTSQTYGVFANNRQNAAVRDCNIRGFFIGLSLTGGAGHLVEDNRLDNNLYVGIVVNGLNSLVQRNRVHDTGGGTSSFGLAMGISAGGTDIIDNTVAGLFGADANVIAIGINVAHPGNVSIRGNRISGLVPSGTGYARGVLLSSSTYNTLVAHNHIATQPSVGGNGIHGRDNADTFCKDNTVAGFGTGIVQCRDSGGNDSVP